MRPIFPSRTQAVLDAVNEANLPNTCTIQMLSTGVSDGAGGYETKWEDIACDVPCRVQPIGLAQPRLVAGQEQRVPRLLLSLPRKTPIPVGRRIRFVVYFESGHAPTLYPVSGGPVRSYQSQIKYECSMEPTDGES